MDFIASIPVIGTVLLPLISFLIVLSVVVFVHEYGHYIVGRWCGIGAEVFSVGFGRRIWAWTDKRGTRWQVASLPLGGYVKFVGDTDPASAGADQGLSAAQKARAFHHAPLWARALTVAAGPFANFLLSIAIFAGLAMWTGKASVEPVIAEVHDETGDLGFVAGDRVLEIDGDRVESFADIVTMLNRSNGEALPALVERDGTTSEISVSFQAGAMIGIVHPGMPASQAGLKPGDVVTAINGEPVTSFYDLQVIGPSLEPEAEVTLDILREGEAMRFAFVPITQERIHPETGERAPIPTLGIGRAERVPVVPEAEWLGPLEALEVGVVRTYGVIDTSLTFLHDMVFTNADTSGLGGPIGIAQMSGEQAAAGIDRLIQLIALISTSIGMLNLFPIPILDGGHLMFYAVEAVRGRPLSESWMQAGNWIGLSLVLFLMVFATYNDLGRLF